MSDRIRLLFTDEEISRITEYGTQRKLSVDLHGMKASKAVTFLKNIILLNRDEFEIHVIHGFNHGTAIKDTIYRDAAIKRRYSLQGINWNPGETILKVKAA